MRSLTIFACLILFQHTSCMSQHQTEIAKIKVRDLSNQVTTLAFVEHKTYVIIFLGTDCPISQKYVSRIQSLKKSYEGKIEIIGVFPSTYSVKQVLEFKKEYGVSLKLFIDDQMLLVEKLKATVTPEVFLISENDLVYSGAIDNWFYDLGKYRTETTENYLQNAIDSLLQGKTPAIKKTEAIGCVIQTSHKQHHHH
jgi:thiol-disulfide isomerase/thioredoxin